MQLLIYIGATEALKISIDPLQKESINSKLHSAVIGYGEVLTFGNMQIHSLKITHWEFTDNLDAKLET